MLYELAKADNGDKDEVETERMRAEMLSLERQNNYTLYYPRDMKYISVLADLESQIAEQSQEKGQAEEDQSKILGLKKSLEMRITILAFIGSKMEQKPSRAGWIIRSEDVFGPGSDAAVKPKRAPKKSIRPDSAVKEEAQDNVDDFFKEDIVPAPRSHGPEVEAEEAHHPIK